MALGWLFFLNPSQLKHSPLSVRLILATYPTLSVLLVAMAASIAFSTRLPAHPRRTTSCSASMLSVLVGDIIYIFVETHALHVPSTSSTSPTASGTSS